MNDLEAMDILTNLKYSEEDIEDGVMGGSGLSI